MKALKITLLLVAVLLLTVSGVQSEDAIAQDENTNYQKNKTNYNLLAHNKSKLTLKSKM